MSVRLSALLVWGLVAAAAVFWTLRLSASSIPVPPAATLAGAAAPSSADLGRLLGVRAPVAAAAAPAIAPDAAARFNLTGVVATGRSEGAGVALISVDGKPARAFRVGDRIETQFILQSVALRSARIGGADGAPGFTLELPPPLPAATGTLPGAVSASIAGSAVPAPGVTLPPPGAAPGMASISIRPPSGPAPMPVPIPGAAGQANEESRMRALSH